MRTDELYNKLNQFDFVENFYVANKQYEDSNVSFRVLKIYGEEGKLSEIYLDKPYMMRTTYQGFDQLNHLERQALLNILTKYSTTPVDQRRSELYFVYYNDLNNIPHFIKRLSNQRLTDDMIPIAYFKTLSTEQRQKYLFNLAELEEFPHDYRPRFTPDSFVKTKPYEEFEQDLIDRYPDVEEKPNETHESKRLDPDGQTEN